MSISEADVQSHFLDALLDSHGEAKPGLANAIWRRLPANVTIDALEQAAEKVIRTLNIKSIPSPKVCLDFITASINVVPFDARGSRSAVTRETYNDRAIAYMMARRFGDHIGHMIEPGTQEWREWRTYFEVRDIPHHRMLEIERTAKRVDQQGNVTWQVTDLYMVPAVFPRDFDGTFSLASVRPEKPIVPLSLERRREIVAKVKASIHPMPKYDHRPEAAE